MSKRSYSLPERIGIARRFAVHGDVYMVTPYGGGHINDTFTVEVKAPAPRGHEMRRYLLQRINTDVFARPGDVMDNIKLVTEKQHESIRSRGGNPLRESLTLVNTRRGKHYLAMAEDNSFWRCYHFIEGARTYDFVPDSDFGGRLAYHAAHAFGLFQKELAGLPGSALKETIKDFHHTPSRVRQLEEAVAVNYKGRASVCRREIAFARERYESASVIAGLLEREKIPVRVSHNDTKVNNVMFDYTGAIERALAVIDLDTVMPGSSLYDFGDLVRTSTCPAAEDEQDISRVYVSMYLYERLTAGWLAAVGETLTLQEIACLPLAGRLVTLNIGMRFLADFLTGDRYFHTQRENHNLDRARVQFGIIDSLERQAEKIEETVKKLTG